MFEAIIVVAQITEIVVAHVGHEGGILIHLTALGVGLGPHHVGHNGIVLGMRVMGVRSGGRSDLAIIRIDLVHGGQAVGLDLTFDSQMHGQRLEITRRTKVEIVNGMGGGRGGGWRHVGKVRPRLGHGVVLLLRAEAAAAIER